MHQGGSEDVDKLHFAKQSLSEIGRLLTRLIVMALTDQMAGAHPRRLERPHDPPPFAPAPALLDIPRTHRSVRRPSRGRASPTHSHSRPRRFLAPDEASPVATDCLDLGCSCSSGCNTNPWVHVRLPGFQIATATWFCLDAHRNLAPIAVRCIAPTLYASPPSNPSRSHVNLPHIFALQT